MRISFILVLSAVRSFIKHLHLGTACRLLFCGLYKNYSNKTGNRLHGNGIQLYRVYKKSRQFQNGSQPREATSSMKFFVNIDCWGTCDVE